MNRRTMKAVEQGRWARYDRLLKDHEQRWRLRRVPQIREMTKEVWAIINKRQAILIPNRSTR